MEQDFQNFELIVINDASSDDTKDVLEKYERDERIRIIHNPTNLGLQACLNIGLALSKGEYIARLDDDDHWIRKDKLTAQIERLDEDHELGIVGTQYIVDDVQHFNPLTDQEIRRQMLFRCPFRHSTVMYRKRLIEEFGDYDEALTYSEDWDLWLRLGIHCKMLNLEMPSTFISSEENASSRYLIRQIPINIKLIKKHRKNYPDAPKALFYQYLVKIVFSIIPVNGTIHNFLKNVYLKRFKILGES